MVNGHPGLPKLGRRYTLDNPDEVHADMAADPERTWRDLAKTPAVHEAHRTYCATVLKQHRQQPQEATVQPSIGRIVHYTLNEQDEQRIVANQNRPLADGRSPLANSARAGDVFPAVIVRVWNADPEAPLCNLHVLLDGELTAWVTSRAEGTAPGTWSWPPRT